MQYPLSKPSSPVRIGILGLGYVGLPLATRFGRQIDTIGFDLDSARIEALRNHLDDTGEVSAESFDAATHLQLSDRPEALADRNVFIVTVPTPIDSNQQPDLAPLELATEIVAKVLSPGAIVIYESTVYPGATEEFCAPILSRRSGLALDQDFYLGYSPERINPGDHHHRLEQIPKVVAASTQAAADFVDALYQRIIPAGTYRTRSIRVAEAAKVIENTQRDLNIALINELAMIFHRLDLDTSEVLAAAATKWNFVPYKPGLVGGHCIGVDPYYLTHKAVQVGHHPEVILAGRKLNDGMGRYVAKRVIECLEQRDIAIPGARILILGLAFKENCRDLRNSQVADIVRALSSLQAQVEVYDPLVCPQDAHQQFNIELTATLREHRYDAVVIAVAHDAFRSMGIDQIRRLGRDPHILFDVKAMFSADQSDGRL